MLVVDEIMQSNYLCIVLHVKRKKVTILTVFTDSQLVSNFEETRTVTIFGEHGRMAHKP